MEAREQFDKTLRTASEIGVSFDSLLDMDIRQFNKYVDGYILRRETRINDDLLINHLSIDKLLQGINGSKQFRQPIKQVKLFEEDSISNRNAKLYRTLKAKGLI